MAARSDWARRKGKWLMNWTPSIIRIDFKVDFLTNFRFMAQPSKCHGGFGSPNKKNATPKIRHGVNGGKINER
jgi:hypothetical protein